MRQNAPTAPRRNSALLVTVFAAVAITGCGDRKSTPASDGNAAPIDAEETRARAVLGQPDHWEPAPEDGVELGFGWDSRRGKVIPNRCVSMTPVRMPGQVAQLHLSEVTDTSEVMKSLGVSASVSVKSIYGKHFDGVPRHASPRQVTKLEEDKISAYYGGGKLYADPAKAEPFI